MQLWRSPCWGHPAYPGSASPQLLVARHYHPAWQPPEGNPLNPSLLSSTYFSARRISGTLASYLFINPHSHPAASQYKNMFLVLHCQVNCGVRKSWDRFVIFCRKMINALHSFGICQTPKIFAPLKWTPPSTEIIHSHIWNRPPTYLKHTSMLDNKGRRSDGTFKQNPCVTNVRFTSNPVSIL